MDLIPTGEDWRGITSPAIRRKLQNRLNQREYRRRRKENPGAQPRRSRGHQDGTHLEGSEVARWNPSGVHPDLNSILNSPRVAKRYPKFQAAMTRLIAEAEVAHSLGARISHHLPAVIGLNVFSAFIHNCIVIGLDPTVICEEVLSPFCPPLPAMPQGVKLAPRLPPALMPTETQMRVPHHPWVDLLPFPGLRDNILFRLNEVGEEVFEQLEDGLCTDILCRIGEVMLEPDEEVGENHRFQNMNGDVSLIVWGKPWDSTAWEVSEGYSRKHAWTLRGCRDLRESTNFWRAKRGEPPLVWEVDDE